MPPRPETKSYRRPAVHLSTENTVENYFYLHRYMSSLYHDAQDFLEIQTYYKRGGQIEHFAAATGPSSRSVDRTGSAKIGAGKLIQ